MILHIRMIRPNVMSFAVWLNFAKVQKYSARFGLIFRTYSHRHSAQSVTFIVVGCLVFVHSTQELPRVLVERNAQLVWAVFYAVIRI